MEIKKIMPEQAEALHAYFTPGAVEDIKLNNAFGLVMEDEENNRIAGAIAIYVSFEEAEVASLFVPEAYRHQGIATALLSEAIDLLVEGSYLDTLSAYISAEKDVYDFLVSKDFEDEISHMATYHITVENAAEAVQKYIGKRKAYYLPYKKLTTMQKKALLKEPIDLSDFIRDEVIEPDISLIDMKENNISSLIIFTDEEKDIVLSWARAGSEEKDTLNFIAMSSEAVEIAAKKYKGKTTVYIPVINEDSEKLVKKLFGESLETASETKRLTLSLN